ncbi:hypothetical protein M441DRAFT_56643 [Trichoderma asperellum CBS 433.97]|uniref:Heterokaryon incompatibility domain-containing protein n=1 Tax=Trichoderma asperellum (strain ATCC 204424 / CBS 433.97 / NBRC 101777) TaxID=1042311 RepID=A0A2T3ZFV2_TRIA4|nr:hypothetical protein M441DRAFT_56643 [Trichoderma asperellum CBS 433.97]PTB43659.1 hypothetical protein M441DRAFT_56643 [Trichoderma asperellum CBS 433.97]
MTSNDDKDRSLCEISKDHETSIISQLVDIGSEHNQQRHAKFLPFISRLQCLELKGGSTQLRRTSINAFDEGEYVALSYTWQHSESEDDHSGRYFVEDWDDKRLKPSAVRNCVFDRVLGYMRHAQVQFLWIDAHCICQDTRGVAACAIHDRCTHKRDALPAMDLVYQLSKHPVALLARPLQSKSELGLLKGILSGNFVYGSHPYRLPPAITVNKATAALRLLHEITRDLWWSRAWTFQENYRGGKEMRLLIRHDGSLERQKLQHQILFGDMPGELCIRSINFSKEATRLCLALDRVNLSPDDKSRIEHVKRAAGRYTELLPKSSAMTPTIVADIEKRGMEKPWDRLAIVANCCQYTTLLDYEALSKQGCSLSLSVLAMCLLNGEILDNSDSSPAPVASLTTSAFLERKLFKAFSAPEDDTKTLTFNKGCRLTDVELTAHGILAKGHLWKLGRVINTKTFGWKLPWINKPNGRLERDQRRRLLQLVYCLNDLEHFPLAERIDQYLADDAEFDASEDFGSFTEMYFHHMADELASAIEAGRKLRLGSIYNPTGQTEFYRAVFVWSGDDEYEYETECEDNDMSEYENVYEDEVQLPPAYAFTSAWFRNPGSETHDANDIDRHVSLEVSRKKSPYGDGFQHLRVRRWLLGLCFFEGCPRTEVVFPWPRALQACS